MTDPDGSADSVMRNGNASRRKFLTVAGALGATGLAGCSGGGGGGGGGTNTVKIASLNPMSGAYSSLGPGQREGVKVAVNQINNSDEYDYEVEPVYGDTETAAGPAQQAAQRAVRQERADFVFGAISSSVALSLNKFAKQNEFVYFPGGAAVPITGKACNKWVFRFETNTAQIAEAISAYTVNNLGTNVWFHIADYAYGDSVYKRTKERMQAANDNFTEVGKSASKLGSSNFGSYISQISNSNADVVVLGMTGGDLINFVNQAADRGLKDDVDIVSGTTSFQVVRKATGKSSVGTYGGVRYNADIQLGDNQQFVDAFKSAHGRRPGNFARVGYESIRMMVRGMQRAGSTDPADVRKELSGSQHTTVLGDVTLRKCDHQATNPTWMSEIVADGDDSNKYPDVKLLDKTDDSLPPCSEVNCNLS